MRVIDADALIENIVEKLGVRSEEYLTAQESAIVNEIYNAPTIEPKQGEWIDNTSETWTPSKKCSKCGLVVHSVATDSTDFHAKTKMNYCPNCGARMEVTNETH